MPVATASNYCTRHREAAFVVTTACEPQFASRLDLTIEEIEYDPNRSARIAEL